jgi:hypothetical protein
MQPIRRNSCGTNESLQQFAVHDIHRTSSPHRRTICHLLRPYRLLGRGFLPFSERTLREHLNPGILQRLVDSSNSSLQSVGKLRVCRHTRTSSLVSYKCELQAQLKVNPVQLSNPRGHTYFVRSLHDQRHLHSTSSPPSRLSLRTLP